MKVANYLEKLNKKTLIITERVKSIDCIIKENGLQLGVVGQTKITNNSVRVLFNDAIISFHDIDFIDDKLYSYSEIAKAIVYYITDNLSVKKYRFTTNDIYSVPSHYAIAGTYNDYAYVDVKSFYYSVYKLFWGAKYKRLSYLGKIADVSNFLDNLNLDKRIKVSIFGIISSNSILNFKRSKDKITYYQKKIFNSLSQPDLINLIYDISQCLCFYFVKFFEAVYCNVDGFIIPAKYVNSAIDFLSSINLNAKVKASGDATIMALGHYKVGNYETKNFNRLAVNHNCNNLLVNEKICDFLFQRLKRK